MGSLCGRAARTIAKGPMSEAHCFSVGLAVEYR